MKHLKTRLDFVTNSSSSSFIINKKQNYNSVEEVFLFLKSLYIEYLKKRKELIEYCKNDKRFDVIEENNKTTIKFNNSSIEERMTARDLIEQKFGMTWYDISCNKIDWLNCKTYSEFLEYTKDDCFYINIIDLSNPQFNKDREIDSIDTLIEWYMPCFTNDCKMDCETCEYKEYCYMDNNDRIVVNTFKNTGKKSIINAVFGRFCICSECGYIPEYVVRKLEEVSTFSCNHMG